MSENLFTLKPNTIIRGRYLVGEMLGQGGFAMTYAGHDLALDIKVAIKEYFPLGVASRNQMISNQVFWNPTQVTQEEWQDGCDSFLKEARRLAKIDSLPGIVRVRDTFPENQTAYIVMDYVEGQTLEEYLHENGTMDIDRCLKIFYPLMESLKIIHQKELVHRDISPDNIMIQPDGTLCLLDFGAAKDISLKKYTVSKLVAKRGFSPLEQYTESGKIGPWTDVYALCATIYYCVTGKLVQEAIDRAWNDTFNLDDLKTVVPANVIRQLKRGLAVSAKERISSIDALLVGLEIQLDGKTSIKGDNDTSTGKKKKMLVLVALGIIVLIIAISLFFWWKSGSDALENTSQNDIETNQVIESKLYEETTSDKINETKTVVDEKTQKLNEELMVQQNRLPWDSSQRLEDNVFQSEYLKSDIRMVFFVDRVSKIPQDAVDVWKITKESFAPVTIAVVKNGTTVPYDLYIGAKYGVSIGEAMGLFQNYTNVKEIHFNDCVMPVNIANMEYMFSGCSELEYVDINCLGSGLWQTGVLKSTAAMFYNCSSMKSLDLSDFDVTNIRDLSTMFKGCTNLTDLNMDGWVIPADAITSGMFDGTAYESYELETTPDFVYRFLR